MTIDTEREEKLLSVGRPPTAYERLVFAVHRRDPIVARSSGLAAKLDELIEELVRNPDTDAERLIESTDLATDGLEGLLLRRLLRSTDDKKHAALQLLAVCGSSQSIPALLRLGRRDAFRDAALTTMEQIVGIEKFAGYVGQTTDPRVRAALIRRLLTADSEAGLRGYLSLVGNDGTRAEALTVADDVPQPPSAALLESLDDEDETVRLSAALVLGHLNGPNVTRALVDRITQNPAEATEAWIALLACRGELAGEFLDFASRKPQLLVHVNSARVWWARVVN